MKHSLTKKSEAAVISRLLSHLRHLVWRKFSGRGLFHTIASYPDMTE